MKRISSILMTLLLGLSLFIPAMAIIDPYIPVFKKAPKKCPYLVKAGDTLALEIEAECREGFEGEISYTWHVDQHPEFDSTGPKLELNIPKDMTAKNLTVSAWVANTYIDRNGETQMEGGHLEAYVIVYRCWLQKPFLLLRHHLMLAPSRIQNWWQNRKTVA